ncbi:MAG: glycosyltransferase family 2 protein [Nitrospinae bacterium]|nr:glycosyltransferase family 2 protein [Nitrospinota bacterium]
MASLSVVIITRNEEANIHDCLASCAFADEIVVVDSFSTDRTVEICREHTGRVIQESWRGFGRQKNFAIEQAKGPWIFNLDADERITPALRAEIEAITAADEPQPAGYYVARRNYFGDRWVRHCGWYPDYTLRLFRKGAGWFNERAVHEAVELTGHARSERLQHPIEHYTYASIGDFMERLDRYTTLAAEEDFRAGRRGSLADLAFRPPFTFFKMYLLRKGFLEGSFGLTLSGLYAIYTYVKYAKLREMNQR